MSKQEDFDWQSHINIDPAIMGGEPLIAGTRVTVEVLLAALAGGTSTERVVEAYRIAPEDLRAAIAYAAESLRLERVHALPG